jgi:hypothetical protein
MQLSTYKTFASAGECLTLISADYILRIQITAGFEKNKQTNKNRIA